MKTQKLLESFFRMGTLTLCIFLLTLLAQGGEGAYANRPSCALTRDNFENPYMAHQVMSLALQASLEDQNTSTQLLDTPMFKQFKYEDDRCYLLKELMGLFLAEMGRSYPPRFQLFVRDVFPYFLALKNWLDDCPLIGDDTPFKREIDIVKNKLKELGENRQIKVFSELHLLLAYTDKYCTE